MAFIKDNPPPATIILISGDRDFAYLLSTVRWRKYNVVLISNSFMTHESLTVQASVVYDWKSDILKTQPSSKPLALPGSQTFPSVASLTTPRESDNRSESSLSNERVAPAIQPMTPPPRPASTAAITTTRPRRATILSDAPSMEFEPTPIPPKAGTPTNSASPSIPTNPTPDGWIVANLVGGSTIVRPLVVQGVAVDLVSTGSCLAWGNRSG